MWVMKIMGTANKLWDRPEYLERYDLEYAGGMGAGWTSPDIKDAMKFNSLVEVIDTWKSVSKTRPVRFDGRPNRPLTAYTIEPTLIEEEPNEKP